MSETPTADPRDMDRSKMRRQLRRMGFAFRRVGRAFMTGEQRYARPTELAIDGGAYRRRVRRRTRRP